MIPAIDRVIFRSIIAYCREVRATTKPVVERSKLEEVVNSVCRARAAMTPSPGHIWACALDLHRNGNIEGMVDGDRIGVTRARLSVPKKKVHVPSKQLGFGIGESE
jgi:hypothetical protein